MLKETILGKIMKLFLTEIFTKWTNLHQLFEFILCNDFHSDFQGKNVQSSSLNFVDLREDILIQHKRKHFAGGCAA